MVGVPPSSDQDKRQLGQDAARAGGPAPTLELVLAADWISPSVARDKLRAWLRAHDWSPSHVDDLVLAVNEAVSNSVEHGYLLDPESPDPPKPTSMIEVRGRVGTEADGTRRIAFTVRDHGTWIVPDGRASNRGQGIRIMRACVEDLAIAAGEGGTTVTMTSRPMPPAP